MTASEKNQLQIFATKVRMGIIESTHGAKAGHPGGSLSAADKLKTRVQTRTTANFNMTDPFCVFFGDSRIKYHRYLDI